MEDLSLRKNATSCGDTFFTSLDGKLTPLSVEFLINCPSYRINNVGVDVYQDINNWRCLPTNILFVCTKLIFAIQQCPNKSKRSKMINHHYEFAEIEVFF